MQHLCDIYQLIQTGFKELICMAYREQQFKPIKQQELNKCPDFVFHRTKTKAW